MKPNRNETGQPGFCIYIQTLAEGAVPLVRDDKGRPCVFTTEREAQLEIADAMMTRLQEFLDDQREFEDAIETEEYVMPVTVFPDGSILEEDGRLVYDPEKAAAE